MHIILNSTKDTGLEINIHKTNYIIISRERVNGNSHLTTDEGNFKKTCKFE